MTAQQEHDRVIFMLCFCVIQREIPDRRDTQECLRKNYAILISYRCNKLDENCRACDFNCSTIFILKHYFVERKTLWRFSNLQNDDSYFKSIKSSIYNVKLLFIKFTDMWNTSIYKPDPYRVSVQALHMFGSCFMYGDC